MPWHASLAVLPVGNTSSIESLRQQDGSSGIAHDGSGPSPSLPAVITPWLETVLDGNSSPTEVIMALWGVNKRMIPADVVTSVAWLLSGEAYRVSGLWLLRHSMCHDILGGCGVQGDERRGMATPLPSAHLSSTLNTMKEVWAGVAERRRDVSVAHDMYRSIHNALATTVNNMRSFFLQPRGSIPPPTVRRVRVGFCSKFFVMNHAHAELLKVG